MVTKVGITEKRLANKRFRRSEEAILRAFFNGDNYISMGKMAAKAGVARSTVYHHHRAVRDIVPDYEKYILRRYRCMVKKLLKSKKLKIRVLYFKILCFILLNKRIFEILIKTGGDRIFKEMLLEIRMDLSSMMHLPKNSLKLFAVYKSEVAELVYNWGRKGFNERDIERLLDEIIYLTETARERLKILLD